MNIPDTLRFDNPLIIARRSVIANLHLGNLTDAAYAMVTFHHAYTDPHGRMPIAPNGFSLDTW